MEFLQERSGVIYWKINLFFKYFYLKIKNKNIFQTKKNFENLQNLQNLQNLKCMTSAYHEIKEGIIAE